MRVRAVFRLTRLLSNAERTAVIADPNFTTYISQVVS